MELGFFTTRIKPLHFAVKTRFFFSSLESSIGKWELSFCWHIPDYFLSFLFMKILGNKNCSVKVSVSMKKREAKTFKKLSLNNPILRCCPSPWENLFLIYLAWGKAAFGTPSLALSTWDFANMAPMRFAGHFYRYLNCRSVLKRADLENELVCWGAPHTLSLLEENFHWRMKIMVFFCHLAPNTVWSLLRLLGWFFAISCLGVNWNRIANTEYLFWFCSPQTLFLPALVKSHCLYIKHITDFFELHLFTFSQILFNQAIY